MDTGLHPIILTDSNFQKEVLECPGLVLVEFVAYWSGSCKLFSSIIAQLNVEFQEQFKLGIIDFDQNRELVRTYSVQSLPTLFFFRQGTAVDCITGVAPRMTVLEKICTLLKKKDDMPGSIED